MGELGRWMSAEEKEKKWVSSEERWMSADERRALEVAERRALEDREAAYDKNLTQAEVPAPRPDWETKWKKDFERKAELAG
jgi:hypothetical protein